MGPRIGTDLGKAVPVPSNPALMYSLFPPLSFKPTTGLQKSAPLHRSP